MIISSEVNESLFGCCLEQTGTNGEQLECKIGYA